MDPGMLDLARLAAADRARAALFAPGRTRGRTRQHADLIGTKRRRVPLHRVLPPMHRPPSPCDAIVII